MGQFDSQTGYISKWFGGDYASAKGGNPSYGFNDYNGGYADGTYGEVEYDADPDNYTPEAYSPPVAAYAKGYSPAVAENSYAPAAAAEYTGATDHIETKEYDGPSTT